LIRHPGDMDAWEKLYHILWPWVVGMAHAQLRGDISEAEDISQEVMLRLVRIERFGGEFEEPRLFRGYVKRICQHLVIDRMRKRIHERAIALLPDQADLSTAKAKDELWPLLTIGQARTHLEREEIALLDLWLGGYSAEEMAEQLGLSAGTVYNRMTELRKRLRVILTHVPAQESK